MYDGGTWFTVYQSGAVSIEHEGVAGVFYCKQKPQGCTVNHKQNAIVQLACMMQSLRYTERDWSVRTQRVATSDDFWELAGKCVRLARAGLGIDHYRLLGPPYGRT